MEIRWMGSALIAAVMCSCAGSSPATRPPPAPATATAAATPPAEAAAPPAVPTNLSPERRAFWKDLHSRGGAPGAGADLAALTRELTTMLADPDPEVRDVIAYDVLTAWIRKPGVLPPAVFRDLREALLAGLLTRPAAPGAPAGIPDDTVFGRSFSALILSEMARRELTTPSLSDAELGAEVTAARTYAAAETDLRGRVAGRGWAHAAAHTADWLMMLSRNPSLGRARGQLVLDAILDLTVRRHGFVLCDGEDGRLAQPVLDLLRKRHIDRAMFAAFVDKLLAPLRVSLGPKFDDRLYAAHRNARNLAFTLFVQLSLEPKPTPAITEALAVLTAALRG